MMESCEEIDKRCAPENHCVGNILLAVPSPNTSKGFYEFCMVASINRVVDMKGKHVGVFISR